MNVYVAQYFVCCDQYTIVSLSSSSTNTKKMTYMAEFVFKFVVLTTVVLTYVNGTLSVPSSPPGGKTWQVLQVSRTTQNDIEWQPPPCPTPDELISPCVCNSTKNEIICRGVFEQSEQKLRNAFEVFSKLVPNAGYNSVSISLRGLVWLENAIFGGIRTNTVLLRSSNLTYIDRNAFRGTEQWVQRLLIYKTKLTNSPPKYDFFAAVRSLKNLETLTINDNNLPNIPDKAFSINDSSAPIQLKFLVITNGTIESIGTDAFAGLSKLNLIRLTNNLIANIKPYAFRTNYSSNSSQQLVVDLTDNPLNESSFQPESFLGAQRPIKINFGLGGCSTRLSTLPENIFRPFLDYNEANMIDVGPECFYLKCDCSMTWILDEKYVDRVKNFRCLNHNTSSTRKSISYWRYMNDVNCSTVKLSSSHNGLLNTSVRSSPSHTNGTTEDSRKIVTIPKHSSPTLKTTPTLANNSTTQLVSSIDREFCQNKNCLKQSIEMSSYMNLSIDPCENFYDFACNGWENNHLLEYLLQVLSNGGSEYDNFVKVRLRIEENLDKLMAGENVANIGKSSKSTTATVNTEEAEAKDRNVALNIPAFTRVKSMYNQCINPPKGPNHEALQLVLTNIGGWPLLNPKQFDKESYNWEKNFVTIFNNYKDNIFVDVESTYNENSTKHLVIKGAGFVVARRKLLSMRKNRLENYANYILNTVKHFSTSQVSVNETMQDIWQMIKFEKQIANIVKRNSGGEHIDRRIETIGCLIHEINWLQILFDVQNHHKLMNETQFVNCKAMYDIHYLIDLSRLLSRTDTKVIANYLGWRVIESIGFLFGGSSFVDIQQNFYSTESREAIKMLKKQCLEPLTRSLPYLMSRAYLDRYLPLGARKNARTIAESVRRSFVKSMAAKDWIDDAKADLIKRVEAIKINIGYPDWILDDRKLISYYQPLEYTRTNKENSTEELVRFYSKVQEVKVRHMLYGICERTNKTHFWDPLPLYVGASYDIVDNVISVPMGLLQSPFYEENRPFYLNYASLGSFFGHEVSHSVTPRYTEFERLQTPWTDQFLKEFLSKAQCFVTQYTNYYDKIAEQHLDGVRTFEEDMSDLAGIQASFHAFQVEKTINNETALRLQELPEFSPDQLFFISFAQKWCRSNSRLTTRLKISKSLHSPEKYRVNGALSNFDAFAQAFNCSVGTPMNPAKKCESW